MIEILLDDRSGHIYDIPFRSMAWKTSRIGRAGTLDVEFILPPNSKFQIKPGSVIRAQAPNKKFFYGYVFEVQSGKDETVQVKAYDQIRYLLTNDTYVFKNITATDAIKKICADFKMRVGTFDDTKFKIPTLVQDDQKVLDTICKLIDATLMATKQNFVLFDNFGNLALKNQDSMKLQGFYIGDDNLIVDFSYKRSIDEAANKIKVVRDNKTTKKRDVFVIQDSASFAKWGTLQHYEKVDDNANDALVKEYMSNLLKLKNRETKSLQVECLGDWRVRAGCYVLVKLDKMNWMQYFLIEECEHKVEDGVHTMSLELKVF